MSIDALAEPSGNNVKWPALKHNILCTGIFYTARLIIFQFTAYFCSFYLCMFVRILCAASLGVINVRDVIIYNTRSPAAVAEKADRTALSGITAVGLLVSLLSGAIPDMENTRYHHHHHFIVVKA